MTELSREQILDISNRWEDPSVLETESLCRMALRAHDAEQRAQRAEAECERLRETLRAIVYATPKNEHWRWPHHHWYLATAREALATPPTEGEPPTRDKPKWDPKRLSGNRMLRNPEDAARDVSNFDAPHTPEKAESYPLDSEGRCLKCGGTGRIGVDSTREPCPACTSLPSQQAHGDALADEPLRLVRMAFREGVDAENVETAWEFSDAVVQADMLKERIDALTASGVPDGYKLVPVEPTEEMLAAVDEAQMEHSANSLGADLPFEQAWAEALAAAPTDGREHD